MVLRPRRAKATALHSKSVSSSLSATLVCCRRNNINKSSSHKHNIIPPSRKRRSRPLLTTCLRRLTHILIRHINKKSKQNPSPQQQPQRMYIQEIPPFRGAQSGAPSPTTYTAPEHNTASAADTTTSRSIATTTATTSTTSTTTADEQNRQLAADPAYRAALIRAAGGDPNAPEWADLDWRAALEDVDRTIRGSSPATSSGAASIIPFAYGVPMQEGAGGGYVVPPPPQQQAQPQEEAEAYARPQEEGDPWLGSAGVGDGDGTFAARAATFAAFAEGGGIDS